MDLRLLFPEKMSGRAMAKRGRAKAAISTLNPKIEMIQAVTVEIGEGRHNTIEKAVASFDGDTQISMVTGDRIVIRKATVRTKILKLNHLSFVEVLRQKMSNS